MLLIEGGGLYRLLPRLGKHRYKGGKRQAGRSMIPVRIDISQRPALVERKSRLTLLGKIANKRAETVCNKMITMLRRVDSVRTITLDNGEEFAQHVKVSTACGAKIFFARPYASYQRGTNENTNGLIRRCWPKKMRMGGSLNQQDIRDMELRLNMTTRKVLDG